MPHPSDAAGDRLQTFATLGRAHRRAPHRFRRAGKTARRLPARRGGHPLHKCPSVPQRRARRRGSPPSPAPSASSLVQGHSADRPRPIDRDGGCVTVPRPRLRGVRGEAGARTWRAAPAAYRIRGGALPVPVHDQRAPARGLTRLRPRGARRATRFRRTGRGRNGRAGRAGRPPRARPSAEQHAREICRPDLTSPGSPGGLWRVTGAASKIGRRRYPAGPRYAVGRIAAGAGEIGGRWSPSPSGALHARNKLLGEPAQDPSVAHCWRNTSPPHVSVAGGRSVKNRGNRRRNRAKIAVGNAAQVAADAHPSCRRSGRRVRGDGKDELVIGLHLLALAPHPSHSARSRCRWRQGGSPARGQERVAVAEKVPQSPAGAGNMFQSRKGMAGV